MSSPEEPQTLQLIWEALGKVAFFFALVIGWIANRTVNRLDAVEKQVNMNKEDAVEKLQKAELQARRQISDLKSESVSRSEFNTAFQALRNELQTMRGDFRQESQDLRGEVRDVIREHNQQVTDAILKLSEIHLKGGKHEQN
nr:hypothetical protein 15 [bacterium]